MRKYESPERRRQLESEWDEYKKVLKAVRKRVSNEEFETLQYHSATGLILKLADEKSDGQASKLGLGLTQIASLYQLEWVFDVFKSVNDLTSAWWWQFVNADLSVDDVIAEKYISKASEMKFTKVQEILVGRAEKISSELNKLQSELSQLGATSLPLGNIVKVDHKNQTEVNIAFINTVR